MKRTYIATTQEAKALHDGTQTAIISKMRVQPKCDTHRLYTVLDTTGDKGNTGSHFWAKMDNGYPEHASDYFKLPYVIGQEVVVREAWQIRAWDCQGYIAIKYKDGSVKRMDTGLFPDDENRETNLYIKLSDYLEDIGCEKNEEGDFINFELPWQSAATMPVSAARTRFIPVSCEAVRVREIEYDEAKLICNPLDYKEYAIHKLGQTAWDNNDYIFYYKIEKI